MFTGAFGKVSTTSLMSEYGGLCGAAVLRQRTREAENAARVESEVAQRVKSEFISNMSHELRTPLNTIMGFSKLLTEQERRHLGDGEIVEYAKLIFDASSHLLAVINDILDISKMQSGKYALDAREIDIEEIILSIAASFEKLAEESGVTLTTRLAVGLPRLRGDAVKLTQVFGNLISNAIKFTKPGGSAMVEVSRLADDGAMIAVRDTGVGMTPEEVHVALTPFGQVDGSRARWREGTGLGLPIAKSLISLHGGDFDMRSTKGLGTDVIVKLPPFDRVSVIEARETVFGK